MEIIELLKIDPILIKKAKQELLNHQEDPNYPWSYFPHLKYPHCKLLQKRLEKLLPAFQFIFLRASNQQNNADFGGLHLDVDVGIKTKRTTNKEIQRVIVNLNDLDYELLYGEETSLRPEKYEVLNLPTKKITVPSEHTLQFISSKIPHVSGKNKQGHFIAVFGRALPQSL